MANNSNLTNAGKGRAKGSKNKVASVREILENRGFDPLRELISLCTGGHLDPRDKAKVCMFLIDYSYTKPKPDDSTLPNDDAVKVTMSRKDLIAIAKGE